jgi:hypothetical protein
MQQKNWKSAPVSGLLVAVLLALGTALAEMPARADEGDPPGRVARLSYQAGDVGFAAAGEDNWGQVEINRPLSIGDRLSTSQNAVAELELGGAVLRLGAQGALNVVNLDDRTAQIELSAGTLNLRIRHLDEGETYEIDTPTMAFVANQPGSYRVDVFPDGRGTQVRLAQGGGIAYGENNASYPLNGRQSYVFQSADLSDVSGGPLPRWDDFDRFCDQRDGRYLQAQSQDYVAPEVVGAADLDGNGEWVNDPDYQYVWYPTTVAADWAPYRQGHWAWIDPWGWTWVDDAPWGFAPFHYGRWVYVGARWGWVPGPRAVPAVYSPALVGFVGGGGSAPVGWFPLGPRDVYCPPYRVSRGYFSSVNVANIHNTYVNTTIINTYYNNVQVNRGGGAGFTPDYAYRNRPEATTVVSHDVFAGARPVGGARINIDARQLAAAPISFQSPAIPNRASLGVRAVGGFGARPAPSQVFDRGAVMHRTAPPAPPSFETRQPLIERNQGQPIARPQLQQLGRPQPPPMQTAPAAASVGPRNEIPNPRFQQQPIYGPSTPEQRVPMPSRSEDDRVYLQPRPQAQAPQPQPLPQQLPQLPQQPVPRAPQQPVPQQMPRVQQPLPPQQMPRPQAVPPPAPKPQPREAPPKDPRERENHN